MDSMELKNMICLLPGGLVYGGRAVKCIVTHAGAVQSEDRSIDSHSRAWVSDVAV